MVTLVRGRGWLSDVFAVQMPFNGAGGDPHADGEYRDWPTTAGFGVDASLLEVLERPLSLLLAA